MLNILHSWTIGTSSTAQQRYTPATATTTRTSSIAAQVTQPTTITTTSHLPNINTGNVMQTESSGPSHSPTSPSSVPLWVVFGIKDQSGFNDIENIEMSTMLNNDIAFFKELKRLENSYRWPLIRWFSPYIFSYCKFVQVRAVNYSIRDFGKTYINHYSLKQ